MDSKRKQLKNFYEMKLREHREEIDALKAQITQLSNLLWEIKKELDSKSKWTKEYGDYKDYGDYK